jgi:hypothetical protein
MRPWTRGKAIKDGRLQYVSPSQAVSADHESYGGCERRYYYRRVEGRPEPEYAAAVEGTEGHAQIAEYLHTGKMVLGQHALKAKRFLPEPDPKLQLELDIDDGALTAAGLPVVGFVDWLNDSRVVHLDHGEVYDPAGSVEIVDWKFTGRKEFPTPREVAEALPMTFYGEWAARKRPLEYIRMSHVYIATRRREVSKRSVLVRRSEIATRWVRAEGVVRRLQVIAGCTSPDDVPANLDACDAYGGCPHRSYCSAGTSKTLSDLLGPLAAQAFLDKETPVSLLKIPALAALQAPADPAKVAAEKAALLAQEAAAKVDPAVRAAVEAIRAASAKTVQGQVLGEPSLTGRASDAWAAVLGWDLPPNTPVNGSGLLKDTTIADPDDLPKLAAEIAGIPADAPAPAAPQAMGLLPPDAPVSRPAAPAAASPPSPTPTSSAIPTPPQTTSAQPADAGAGPGAGDSSESAGEMKLSKKARAHVEKLEARIAELEARIAEVPMSATRDLVAAPAAPAGLQVYVDCIPPGTFQDLTPWVREWAKKIADQYGAADVRCGSDDTPLGFGKWPGVLEAIYREAPLDDGVYFLDTRGAPFSEIAAQALRDRARVTRGIR